MKNEAFSVVHRYIATTSVHHFIQTATLGENTQTMTYFSDFKADYWL